jgi:hypothetical protein
MQIFIEHPLLSSRQGAYGATQKSSAPRYQEVRMILIEGY